MFVCVCLLWFHPQASTTQSITMGRGQLLTRIARRGKVKTAGTCMAMAMAVSARGVAAFSTTTTTTTGAAMVEQSAFLPLPSPIPMYENRLHRSPFSPFRRRHHRCFASTTNSPDADCGCDETPLQQGDSGDKDLFETNNIGSLLKETVLTNAEGSPVKLGSCLGEKDDATIVVFLRHLA